MTPAAVSPAPIDPTLLCIGLLIAYFGFWLETRSAIAERLASPDATPSHDEFSRRQAEIDAPAKTRLL